MTVVLVGLTPKEEDREVKRCQKTLGKKVIGLLAPLIAKRKPSVQWPACFYV